MRRPLGLAALAACALLILAPAAWGRPARGPASAPAAEGAEKARPEAKPDPRPESRPSQADQARTRREKARKIAAINVKLTRLFRAGKYGQCEPLLRQILDVDPNNNVAWYNLACVRSRSGQGEKAIRCLNTAVENGYTAFRHMERDPDLDAIRQAPGYKKLLARRGEIQRAHAARIRDELRERFGEGYLYEIDHERRLVFATNVDRTTLADMKQRLSAYASAQWRDLFTHPFEGYVTIVVPKSSDWRWGPAIGGFYSRPGRVLFARSVGYVLVHEFTHALHGADQEGRGQRHPIWITEGLATLFESSQVSGGHALPQPNRRLVLLQMLLKRKRTIPFGQIVKFNHPTFMKRASVAYSQCRYMLMYLHAKGLLRTWYDAYTDGFDKDATGAKAMEAACGKKLGEIEADWRKWVLALEPPVLQLPPKSAYIGIQLRADTDGVHVTEVVKASGADKAGLRPGDVIVAIDGERVVDPALLMQIVHGHEVGDEIEVRYRRGGKYHETAVRLGELPERLTRRRSRRRPAPRARPAPKPKPKPKSSAEPKPKPGHTPAPQVKPKPRPGHTPKPQVQPKRKGPTTQPARKEAA